MLVDTHCHLYFDAFDADRKVVIEYARLSGVQRMLVPGIDLASSRQALELTRQFPEVYAAVGVHPNDALTWDETTEASLDKLACDPKVVAIGEIGLDYYREWTPRELQVEVLSRQLQLASRHNLPVVIHLRNEEGNQDASQALLDILSEWVQNLDEQGSPLAKNPGVIHSFSENSDYARQVIVINFLVGITGPVTFRNASVMRQVVAEVPLESLLTETDSPFLSPHPFRGRRNEPAHVRWVTEKIAEIRSQPLEDVKKVLSQNAERLFHW